MNNTLSTLPPLKHSSRQSIDVQNKILKTSINYKRTIHPRRFCRRWFGLEATNQYGKPRFTESQIIAMECEHGYRERCINLLSRILKIKPNTIHRWGKGVDFDKIPQEKREKYELYLGYVDTIRMLTMSLQELDEYSLMKIWQRLEMKP
ncbi:MAG: hypothetical protein QNJ33_06925 [Crocosphaera sp.]|nr:hypothetical protein [Crocosphaera sp.]